VSYLRNVILMIPKYYPKEFAPPPAFVHFPPYTIALSTPPIVGEYPPIPIPEQFITANANIDSYMQSHRRKMMRRAANRKSAQLSRARKKVNSTVFFPFFSKILNFASLVGALGRTQNREPAITKTCRFIRFPARNYFFSDYFGKNHLHFGQSPKFHSCE
jgi:hypothetical protein